MDNIDFYRNRVLSKGRTKQERIINEKIKSFDNYLNSVPNSSTISINNTEHIVTIQDKTLTKDFTTEKYLLAQVDSTIVVGDTFLWSDDYWIVIYKDDKTIESHQRYIIMKCNNILTIQTLDKTIHSIPCIITDRASVYSDGVEDGKYLRLPDGLINVVIPNNELTNKFILVDKRIIFDNSRDSVYEITKPGKLLKKGLIEIIAEVQVYDSNRDNLELNLADYLEPEELSSPIDSTTLTIIGNDRVSIYNTPVQYTVNTDEVVTWSIIGDTAKIISQSGNMCILQEVDSTKFGISILRAELVVDSSVYAEKEIEIVFM